MPPRPPAFTHFLCLQLVTPTSRPQLSSSLAAFKADATSAASFGIPADAVRPLGTLHLTLGMLSFPGNEGLDRAEAVLRSLKPRELLARAAQAASSRMPAAGSAATGLRLTLRGLRSMQAADKASVLYAPPEDPQGLLRAFCEGVRGEFLAAGVMARDERPLLLHATIVNTIYSRSGGQGQRGGRGQGRGRGGGGRVTLDARDVLDRYEEYVWMEDVPLEKIAICKMGARPVDGEDEAAYEVEVEVEVDF